MKKIAGPPLAGAPGDQVYRYAGNSPAARLERIMFEKKVFSIGTPDSWTKRVNYKGEERFGGLDLTPEARAYRTVDIKKLDEEELIRLHEVEIQRCTHFLTGPSQMRVVLKNYDLPDQVFLQPEQIEAITQFNNANRPIPDRHFLGLPIPPYFAYDYDFDGMRYHHAWDRTVWRVHLDVPAARGKGRGRVSDDL